ncbi:Telomere length regulation protein [Pleurostoma richardsiae]|uniref:Telomere length regulation protein n=1 Tax=Pleurostoma richardsiae TaxID=41990 RepID=A0AA38RLC6_9PEZI|nr:Telomere length regulation protein [Pleurostoma richardsiae]
MEGLLSQVSKTYRSEAQVQQPLLQEVQLSGGRTAASTRGSFQGGLFDEALEALRSEPDYETLIAVLKYLLAGGKTSGDSFSITVPGPQSAKAVQILVADIVPNYWVLLKESDTPAEKRNSTASDLDLLLHCLRSITGINAVLARLRTLLQERRAEKLDAQRTDTALNLPILLELLCDLLDGDDRVQQIWIAASSGMDKPQARRPLTQEVLNLLGGGKILSLAAEAQHVLAPKSSENSNGFWVADGAEYSKWLARNISEWARQISHNPEDDAKLCSDFLGKALRLGYADDVVKHFVNELLLKDDISAETFRKVFSHLPALEQRKILFSIFKFLSERFLNSLELQNPSTPDAIISGVARVITRLVGDSQVARDHLVAWSTNSTGAGLGDGVGIRRAVLAVLSQDRDSILTVLEKSLSQFGDQLYIKHSPILQQEVHVQVLLISASYVNRLAPVKLSLLTKSGSFMNAISNRLAASQTRVRFLGMIVGEALSSLVNKGDKKLNFNMEETNSEEAEWLKGLTHVTDPIGPMDPLVTDKTTTGAATARKARVQPKLPKQPPPPPSKAKAIIEEVDSEESEDDDLVPYAKPESDEEDSDDDPTTVRRDKPKAPVYIRDLIIYLRDAENYDRQKLALTTAPILIRRKANYGTEVKEHAEELASLLIGLEDKYELEDFYNLKLQGMVALVVAHPQKMGPWFAKTFFDGDYSISQRASVLTVLGLSAREISGFETSEYAHAASFPSKTLPERIEKLYLGPETSQGKLQSSSSLKALPSNALDSISRSLTSNFLAPLAAGAADAATGPDVLKLSTFTSRLQEKSSSSVSGSRPAAPRPRVRAIPNTTAQLICTSFFFPLTARFQHALHSTASRARGIVFQPFLLALYLRTLALLLHAAGPSTLALPDMTSELWGLLLGSGVRAHAAGDLGVTHAVLFALLTLLEVNADRLRDLCRDNGREVVETQEWVAQVFEKTRGEDGGEENEVKMLAAGVLIRLREGMDKYRMLLVGDMI